MSYRLLGIYREIQHSPDRESDDALILDRAADRLRDKGLQVEIRKPEEVGREIFIGSEAPELVFMMCEREAILGLIAASSHPGLAIINPPESVLDTYRYRMIPLLKSVKAPLPRTELVSTGDLLSAVKLLRGKAWIKRGDVHNTQKGDVVPVENPEDVKAVFADFVSRGIGQACVQDHVPGDLIKFYGVGNKWFKWFYHKNQDLKKYKFSLKELESAVRKAAACLKLEIYGGDAIADSAGKISLIDLNAWPSFALFRDEAASVIADHIHAKLVRHSRSETASKIRHPERSEGSRRLKRDSSPFGLRMTGPRGF